MFFIEFIHKLTVFFSGVPDSFLLLQNFRLFPERSGSIPFKLEITDDAASRRILVFESMGADEFREVKDAVIDVVPDFYIV